MNRLTFVRLRQDLREAEVKVEVEVEVEKEFAKVWTKNISNYTYCTCSY